MVMHPEIQRRAQDEIDSVTEGKRVPRLDESVHAVYVDLASHQPQLTLYLLHMLSYDSAHSLPYLAAIIKECFRWQSSLPLAVPHRLMEDDEYKGWQLALYLNLSR